MDKSKINKNIVKYIACSLLGVCIILYFVYQVVQMNSSPYKTEVALEREIQDVVTATAFVVRDESYITASTTNGTVVSIAEDGKRVSSGDAVAVVFQNEESAAVYARIKEIKSEIEYYKQLKNRVGVGTNAPSSYNNLIDEACISLILAAQEGIDSNFDEALIDLRNAVTARQLAVGEKLSVEAKLSSLEAELISLEGATVTYNTISSPNPGYYIGSVDGYETAIGYSEVEDINCAEIDALINSNKQEVSENVMGKLVDSFNWYLLCNIPYNMSGDITVGKTVRVNLPNTAVGQIKCTVVSKGDKEGENVAVVLKCNTMNRDVANLRIEEIQIITDEYTGIRINNTAIREKDGEKGVYVIRGNIVEFKKIEIISSSEDYSVIKTMDDSAYVKRFDTVIIEGVDLYDGKIIS